MSSSIQISESESKPVGTRVPKELWVKFKAKIYEEGLNISEFMTKLVEKFVEDQEFRERILVELGFRGGDGR